MISPEFRTPSRDGSLGRTKAVVEVPTSVTRACVTRDVKVKEGREDQVGQLIDPSRGQTLPPKPARSSERSCRALLRTAMARVSPSKRRFVRRQDRKSRHAAGQPPNCSLLQHARPAGQSRRYGISASGPAAPHVRRLAREFGIDIMR